MKWKIEKKILEKLYLKERKSIDEIGEILGIPRYAVNYWRRKYKIQRLTYFKRHPLPKLTKIQKEYLFGALLGDDALFRKKEETYPTLKVTHGARQKDYVFWKYNIWKDIILSGVKKINVRVKNKEYPTFRFYTREHPAFLYFYNLFYKNGQKRVTMEILNKLTPFSLAVWYMDDGAYIKSRGRARLATNAFSHKEHLMFQRYFRERWGLSVNIKTCDSGTHYLEFNTENTIKFFKIIKNYIIPHFSYKINLSRELLWQKIPPQDLQYIKTNYNIESPRLIAYKLGRSLHSVHGIAFKLGVTQSRGGRKYYEKDL